jgi:hypothetical protein
MSFDGNSVQQLMSASPTDDAKLEIFNEGPSRIYIGPSSDLTTENGFPIHVGSSMSIEIPAQNPVYVTGSKEAIHKVRVLATLW